MKPLLLIAVNFVREQRWPIFVLLLWVLLLAFLGLVTDIRHNREDLLFVFKNVAAYVFIFSIFFGGSAIYNERRSRRILAVLAKAVGRAQYLAGLALGVTMACILYCFSLGLTGSWTLGEAGFPVAQVWFFMLALVTACMLAGTVALMFSTFLNPFFAAGATALVLIVPALARHSAWTAYGYIIPLYPLTATLMTCSFRNPGAPFWWPLPWAVLETVVFWALAARIFSRTDVVVAVD
jgi:ABC-type transport system involved in multi-copper enzyme maturation permease subunit